MSINSDTLNIINTILINSPFGKSLGFELVCVDPDIIELKLPFKRENVAMNNTIHGGAIASLIDVAGAICASSAVEPENLQGGGTSSLSVNYLKPADSIDLIAYAKVVLRKPSHVVSEVLVNDPENNLIAIALVTTHLSSKPDDALKVP
ncbi:MAG: PaaI family thioesterase [Cellulophaga sp.]